MKGDEDSTGSSHRSALMGLIPQILQILSRRKSDGINRIDGMGRTYGDWQLRVRAEVPVPREANHGGRLAPSELSRREVRVEQGNRRGAERSD